ncbi:membrane protein [Desulfosporosinus sp. OT]|uniref:membrane protein n=1 Tax=Desulfosporosinus sp. OT TaxID=913865 RepID=UPI000223A0A7|nr:membrane protein [Desulfosporosinus sp. OT]EGW35979.1 putative membrane protein [Desulfosporosinus sp. OT]
MGLCTCVVLVGPSLGPIIYGLILQFFSWRALFIMLIPMVLICIVSGAVYLRGTIEITKPKIDYLSTILSSIGFALIVYGMSRIGSNFNALITALVFAIGIFALVLLVALFFIYNKLVGYSRSVPMNWKQFPHMK